MSPWIGLTVHADAGDARDLYPGHPLFYVERYYVQVLETHGMNPILLPVLQDHQRIQEYIDHLDGLLLTGGGYLLPEETEQKDLPGLADTGKERFKFELSLLKLALLSGMPVLGVCRGAQMINEFHGGKLKNLVGDAASKHQQTVHHIPGNQPVHEIVIDSQSRLGWCIGCKRIRVNSFHKQVIERPGRGLKAVAWSEEDNVIEAIEGESHPWLMGVQFHPEQLWEIDQKWSRLYNEFCVQAYEYQKKKYVTSKRTC